jgi:predicted dehydrogenase
MRKIAVMGLWHVHAEEYYKSAVCAECEVVGAYDDDSERLNTFCEKYGVRAFDSFEELLASDADGVTVGNATCDHTETIIRIAEAGKDIFTEKILAFTVADCLRVKEAVERNGVQFVIGLVHKSLSLPKTVKKVADSGELGKINYVRVRNCHDGSLGRWLPPHFYNKEQCGGGAMIDLGAHGMYLCSWILGMPDTYSSTFTECCGDGVEDNAVTVMGYKNGAIALNETGFVSKYYPMTFEVCGEKGRVCMQNGVVMKATTATDGALVEVEKEEGDYMPIYQFLYNDVKPGYGIDEAIELTEMMEKAYSNTAK